VVPHHDADGLSAGVLLQRRTGGEVLHVGTPWEDPLGDDPAVVADWGVRPLERPTEVLYVDHHAAPEPVNGTVVAPADGGQTSTSLVAWELLGTPPEGAWLAALGAVGDLGREALASPGVPRIASASKLAKLASLVTAPGRVREGPVAEAFQLLADAEDADAALADPRRERLQAVLDEIGAARARAMKTGPKVGADAALIRFGEPARVHPLVATAWSRRLAPRVVIAANDGWREGKVSFAVRSAEVLDLRAWLRERYEPPAGAGDYGRGHARATGGSLVPEAFAEFERAVLA
jgi:single-stranded-DNA-specific exonuclease